MSESTAISWTDATHNPWEGCQKVGPGCDNCYAEARNARYAGGQAINWGPGAPRRRTSVSNWRKPIAWNLGADAFEREHGRRRRVFCASLADWLDNAVPIEWLVDLLDLVRRTPRLDWLMLTKRIGNFRPRLELALAHVSSFANPNVHLGGWIEAWLSGDAPAHVWLGATVVNQAEADRDIRKLLAAPAFVRFLSMEPLLSLVDASAWLTAAPIEPNGSGTLTRKIDWVIVGGESGPGARPMHPDWARSLRDQCAAAGVPFHFKQFGEWAPIRESTSVCDDIWISADGLRSGPMHTSAVWDEEGAAGLHKVGKKAAGRLLDGVEHNGFPGGAA